MAGPSKRVRFGDSDYEETLTKWLDEECDSASDIDIVLEDCMGVTDHDSNSECSVSEGDEDEESCEMQPDSNHKTHVFGKNRYRWSTTEVRPSSKTRKSNIITRAQGLTEKAKMLGDVADPFSVWNMVFSDNILMHILQCTNKKLSYMREKYHDNSRHHLKEMDMTELKGFLGLLVYTAIFNSRHENIDRIFATDGTGREIFRAVMSKKRFSVLLTAIRFDDVDSRAERLKHDPVAPISFIFDNFIENCKSLYFIGESATVDEMLVSFRGRCRFKMYMPNKPAKYGLKIQCLTDSRTSYLYNAYIYCGKDSDGFGLTAEERKLLKPTQAMLRLAEPLFNSNINITADNWYSSIQLVDVLRTKKLTYVGTLRKNKAEIPASFLPSRKRLEGSTLYAFREECTLISHVGKIGKAAILISSMHDRQADTSSNKPEIISYYNANKGGVDTLDEICAKSTSSRRTRRWPLVIFFRLLDISTVNSYILHQCYKNNPIIKEKSDFLMQLAKQLVKGHAERRSNMKNIPRELRFTIRRILGISDEPGEAETDALVLQKRKTCHICPSRKRRMTKYLCLQCRKPVCLECTNPICKNCTSK